MLVTPVRARIWCSAFSFQRYAPVRYHPVPTTRLPRFYSTDAGTYSLARSESQVDTTDVQHAEFVAQAKQKSVFESDANRAGRVGETSGSKVNAESQTGIYVGKLSPTSSHLFKLIIPLPPSLHAAVDSRTDSSSVDLKHKTIDTAFLLHPSQPLSHVSRLILGSLPASERDAEVEFRAVSGRDHEAYPSLPRSASQTPEEQDALQADRAIDNEGGPLLYERDPRGGELQEVRWSTSTDLGDFIKMATLSQSFRIVLKPSWETAPKQRSNSRQSEQSKAEDTPVPELSLKIMIPTFDSRTRFLRKRLLHLTREIAEITGKKKELDHTAHRGAQRIAIGGLMGLVGYWGVVFKLTFFSPLGWDVMEPVTYLSGLSTLICSYLFFLYHNREVSYSSVLDLSVSARQKSLYEKAGLDLERWTEMVSEAKGLRREIQRIAQDYDYDWKGQLEDLEHVDVGAAHSEKNDQKQVPPSTEPPAGPKASAAGAKVDDGTDRMPKTSDDTSSSGNALANGESDENSKQAPKIDIDATIDEAVELEQQTRSKEKQRRHGKGGKGEALEVGKEQGEKRAKKYAGEDSAD